MSNVPGILYYNIGRKNLGRLAVSLYTLRQVYDGKCTVLSRDCPPGWFRAFVREMNADLMVQGMGDLSALTAKASLWRYSPFNPTLYMDADTAVVRDPSEMFALAENHGFVTTRFCDWTTTGGMVKRRIEQFKPLLSDKDLQAAIDFGKAVNTGVFAWREGSRFLKPWEKMAQNGWDKECMRRMVDEIACQVLLPKYSKETHVVDDEWNWSGKFSEAKPEQTPYIIHYHGYKHVHPHPACIIWKAVWHKLVKEYGIRSENDRRLNKYIREYPDGLTLCTVVQGEKYAHKLRDNFVKWRATKGLADKHIIIFRVGKTPLMLPEDENHTVVNVPGPPKGISDREYCLSQYVYGPAAHVKTSHWMKLDADCTPVGSEVKLPDYEGYAVAAHRWGYTRVKGDKPKRHWMNTLDDWFWGKQVNFPPDIPVGEKYRHKRYNSFCAIYQTSFTQQVALKCGQRLPIPSEDTTTWYLATQWRLPVLRYNAKRGLTQ